MGDREDVGEIRWWPEVKMNDYEDKQKARRERYEKRAEKARKDSMDAYRASNKIVENIPLGQPIIVGHHSEKRHRSDLKKCHRLMDKSCELSDKAKHYDHKAEAVGRGGISGDDPEAITKLREKVVEAEDNQKAYKSLNAYYRKHKTVKGFPGITDERAAGYDEQVRTAYSWEKQPIPGYTLTNNNANIRRMKKRIEELEARENTEAREPITGKGFMVTEHPEDEGGRIWFEFDAKPPKATCQLMRRYGWKWSPTRDAWIRNLNNAGRAAIEYITSKL